MTKSLNILKKTLFLVHFWSIFPIFFIFFWGGGGFFSGKSGQYNFIWVPSIMPKFRKNEWYYSKKTPGQIEGRKNRQKDGQTLFLIVPFRLTLGFDKTGTHLMSVWLKLLAVSPKISWSRNYGMNARKKHSEPWSWSAVPTGGTLANGIIEVGKGKICFLRVLKLSWMKYTHWKPFLHHNIFYFKVWHGHSCS